MTRANLYIRLTGGQCLHCVAESSSAPEQGYICEELILPLLALGNTAKELALLREHCTMHELRANATYRYQIDLIERTVGFYEEVYDPRRDAFRKGENLTERFYQYVTN